MFRSSTMASTPDYGDAHSCTDVDRLMKRYYLPVAYSVIFIVGLVGNVISIGVYVTKLRPWKSSSVIMVNLALTDLLYVLSMPFLVSYYTNGESWVLGDFMCRFVRFGFHLNLYGSILFLTCLAVFRYMVVVKPLMIAQVQQRVWGIVACAAVWVITTAEITPMLTMISIKEVNNKTYCMDFASTNALSVVWWYGWLLTTLGFLLPLVVVSMCYIGIAKQLAKGPHTSSPCRIRAQRMTVLILVVFVLSFLPYHVLRGLRIETLMNEETPCMLERGVHAAYIISRPLAGLNTFFNLALYTLSGDKFQQAFLSIFYAESWLSKARSLLSLATISKSGSGAAPK
ncbi:2-oxoglutarate receptor 1-like isoform X1 [Myripristis murdjan]|uniref:Oxoglutarate (alpha-ketoglutarate) receptor 1a, tandem duplicate 3 n=2 Tax=Myripristis murdjan TaxID=586833 RepID=A0A667XZM3_9TELE|nr:2-oxoglutarate receptor 1-like isoform X1 [Myripristis murdjan]